MVGEHKREGKRGKEVKVEGKGTLPT